MSDMNFEALLGQYQQSFAEAKEFNDWMPDDGEYLCVIKSVRTGTYDKQGVAIPYWGVAGTLLDNNPELDGKDFDAGFFTAQAFGSLKGAASLLAGKPVSDLNEAHSLLMGCAGTVLSVEIKTNKNKTTGVERKNCYWRAVVPQENPAGSDAVDAPVAEPAPVETTQSAN